MDKVTQSNAANAEESAAAAEELNAQAGAMKQAVAELLQLVGGVSTDDRPTGKTPARAGTAPIVAVASPVANGNGHHAQSARHAGNGAHTRRAEIPLEDNFKDF
jgi:methyl-accepting chemotaxis protein